MRSGGGGRIRQPVTITHCYELVFASEHTLVLQDRYDLINELDDVVWRARWLDGVAIGSEFDHGIGYVVRRAENQPVVALGAPHGLTGGQPLMPQHIDQTQRHAKCL